MPWCIPCAGALLRPDRAARPELHGYGLHCLAQLVLSLCAAPPKINFKASPRHFMLSMCVYMDICTSPHIDRFLSHFTLLRGFPPSTQASNRQPTNRTRRGCPWRSLLCVSRGRTFYPVLSSVCAWWTDSAPCPCAADGQKVPQLSTQKSPLSSSRSQNQGGFVRKSRGFF